MQPITIDNEIMGGKPCFTGTRVPVKNFFDLVARGRSLDEFLKQFPSVQREQAIEVLNLASERIASKPAA